MIEDIAHSYSLLEVDKKASADQIREAYFDLVKVWHPDRFLNESPRLRGKVEEKLKAINLAYENIRIGATVFTATSADTRPDAVELSPELKPVDFGGSWGYTDKENKLVIQPRFESAQPFSEGLALVSEASRFGYIDSRGDYALYPEFIKGRSFSEGLAAVVVSIRWGFIDRMDRFIINPLYDDCLDFSEGLAAVQWRGRWGYIDKTGSFTIKPLYDGARSFADGWAEVKHNQKWGKLKRNGDAYFNGQPEHLAAGKSESAS